MVKIEVSLHCGLDYKWKRFIVISKDVESGIKEIKKQYEFRKMPYCDDSSDSLRIENVEDIGYSIEEVPY